MVGGVGEAGGDFEGVFGEKGGEVVGWGRWGEKGPGRWCGIEEANGGVLRRWIIME